MIATNEELTYEHEWIAELEKLIQATGDNAVYVRWIGRHGSLLAIAFPPRIDGRRIGILLPPQASSGFQGGDITFVLPEEEECSYQKVSDEHGHICLVLKYPHCDIHSREHFVYSELAIATKPELLNGARSSAPLQ